MMMDGVFLLEENYFKALMKRSREGKDLSRIDK
jgi:hypothetical protein